SPTIMLQLSGSPHSRIDLSQSLAELLCAETPDALQPKAEYDAVLVTSADVKGVVLDRHAAAIAGVAERVERRDQRREPGGPAVLKIEEYGRSAVGPLVAVTHENRGAPLRPAERAGFFAVL